VFVLGLPVGLFPVHSILVAALAVQELKSTQEALADATAKLLQSHLPDLAIKGPWDVHGITITSFHLEQLRRSKHVCYPQQSSHWCRKTACLLMLQHSNVLIGCVYELYKT
jgi:hypothetical protein